MGEKMDQIFNDEQLKVLFGCDQGKKLLELRQRQNLRYFVTREGKPWTTLAAMNDVLIGSSHDQEQAASFGSTR
jgi:hypothetical protein